VCALDDTRFVMTSSDPDYTETLTLILVFSIAAGVVMIAWFISVGMKNAESASAAPATITTPSLRWQKPGTYTKVNTWE
jgi:hypothetical protein